MKALVGAFSLIVKTDCETDGSSATLMLCARSHRQLDDQPPGLAADHRDRLRPRHGRPLLLRHRALRGLPLLHGGRPPWPRPGHHLPAEVDNVYSVFR